MALSGVGLIKDGSVVADDIAANVSLGGSFFQGNNGDVGSASGLGDIFRVNATALSANVIIASNTNASAVGPLTVAVGTTLDVNGTLVIL